MKICESLAMLSPDDTFSHCFSSASLRLFCHRCFVTHTQLGKFVRRGGGPLRGNCRRRHHNLSFRYSVSGQGASCVRLGGTRVNAPTHVIVQTGGCGMYCVQRRRWSQRLTDINISQCSGSCVSKNNHIYWVFWTGFCSKPLFRSP